MIIQKYLLMLVMRDLIVNYLNEKINADDLNQEDISNLLSLSKISFNWVHCFNI